MNDLHGSCDVSVVAPCFNEAKVLEEFHRRTTAACRAAVGSSYEIVLVDDGSGDQTWDVMCALSKDGHTVAVRLMRNSGQQLAVTAGLSVARGNRVLLLDADLQDPPELLGEMIRLMDKGADVVYGKRISREGETFFKKTSSAAFYRVMRLLGSAPIPMDTGDFRLLSNRVVQIVLSMPERQRFLRGMVSWVGGKQVPLLYERHARASGDSKFPLSRMLRLSADAITSFSTTPLRLAIWLGLVAGGIAIALFTYTIVVWWKGRTIAGWSSIMTIITLFSCVQFLVLGAIGEYIGRLVEETKGRPLFLIDKIKSKHHEFEPPVDFAQHSFADRKALLDAAKHSSE